MAPRGPGSRIICPMSRPAAVEPTNGEAVECKDPHLHGRSLGSGSRVREAGGPEVRFWEVASITVMFSLGRLDRKNRTSWPIASDLQKWGCGKKVLPCRLAL